MQRLWIRRPFHFLLLIAAGGLVSCEGIDNPSQAPAPRDLYIVDEYEQEVAVSAEGRSIGGIAPFVGSVGVLTARLDENAERVAAPTDLELSWTVADESVATLTRLPGQPRSMKVEALEIGETVATVEVHDRRGSPGTPGYVVASCSFVIAVQEHSRLLDDFEVVEGCLSIVRSLGPVPPTGRVLMDSGETSHEFSLRFGGIFPTGPFSLDLQSSDPSIVEVISSDGGSAFGLAALSDGRAQLEASLSFNGRPLFERRPIPVRVVGEGDPAPSFVLQEGGFWRVIVLDGQVPPEGACEHAQTPGWIDVRVPLVTSSYRFRRIDGSCQLVSNTSRNEVIIRTENTCIAQAIPISGEYQFLGQLPGSTTARVYFFEDEELLFRSPPIPVIAHY